MKPSLLLPGIVCLFLLIVGAVLLVQVTDLHTARQEMQTRSVPSDMLAGTATGGALARLGLLNVVPNQGERYAPTQPGELDLGTGLFPSRRQVGLHLYSTTPVPGSELPSTTSVPDNEIAQGLPIMSVSVLERDLYDEQRGLYRNILEKGREWERQAFVSYFNDGGLVFGSAVGLRLHGGVSRHAEKKSFRLLFRDEYGTDRFPAGALFSAGIDPLTSFVLDAAKEDATQIVDPIALDVSRMVGAIAPETRPVRFFLNGMDMGVYVAMEHVSPRYMRAHYGHDDFTVVRTKLFEKVSGDGYDYWLFHQWTKGTTFTMEELSERVDIENFSRWLISSLLCLTMDHDQGPVVRNDRQGADGRWFFINWDMDTSFGVGGRWGERPWEVDDVPVFGLGTTRQTMLTRLHEDPEWRRYFPRLFTDVLNHELTPARVDALMKRYESIVQRFGLGEPGHRVLRIVRRVLEHRPEVMREWMRKKFQIAEPAHRFAVAAPDDLRLNIDGYPEHGAYTGWYFPGMKVTVDPGDDADRIQGWLVNGERHEGLSLQIDSVTDDLVAEPIVTDHPRQEHAASVPAPPGD